MSTVAAVSSIPTASDPTKVAELARLPGFDRVVKKTLDQGDFLKLLSTQMANQDPMSPQKDTDFIAQMSSFSSSAQMSDMVKTLKAFIVTQDFSSAQSMLGKYVTVTKDKVATSGIVSSVGYDADGVSMIKIGDKSFSPADVTAVSASAPAAETEPTTLPPVTPDETVGTPG